ncbi:MAG: TetR/AcrR family transcriptional regulator [Parasphingorhabdus sp.]|uniref:TetR/AcrR family transcriptional regulator n=1 Tax=Parasphingorhabdus sp. TaxID=2709688 RepID=UPI003003A629
MSRNPKKNPAASPPKRARFRLPREQREADILVAARFILDRDGYDNASLPEIAERAGVVEGTVYRYFDNKRNLFIRLAEDWYTDVLDEDYKDIDQADLFSKLRWMIARELLIIRKNPALTRFILTELRPDPNYRDMPIFSMSRKFTSAIITHLKQGVVTGELSDRIPFRVVRDMIFGGIEHQTWAYLRDEGDFSVDSAADAIAEIIYVGMGGKQAPPSPRNPNSDVGETV